MGADHGSTDSLASADANGASSPHSPRDASFLDAALGYYTLLDRPESGFATPAPGEDDYEQVDFRLPRPAGASPPSRGSFELLPRLDAAQLRRQLSGAATAHIKRIKGQVTKRYSALKRPLRWTRKRVVLRDKIAFVLGVFHIMASAFWLGYSPATFYKLYTVKALLLLTLRLCLYRRDKMHYYLLDFCYYANALMLFQSWALPEACGLQKVLFAFSMGPLAWSIVLFRNSMIFHSLDKMTSVFLHAFPPLVAWSQRWHLPDSNHWKGDIVGTSDCANQPASVRELILIPWLPYAAWAVAYYLKIFIISSKRIQERGYHTLFRYMTRKPKSFYGRLARSLPGWLSALFFMLWHVGFCAITFVATWAMWQSYWLNTTFIVAMIFMSAWNGGNYYFEVFARKYVEDVVQPLEQERRSHSAEPPVQRDQKADAAGDRGVVRASSDGALQGATRTGEWDAVANATAGDTFLRALGSGLVHKEDEASTSLQEGNGVDESDADGQLRHRRRGENGHGNVHFEEPG